MREVPTRPPEKLVRAKRREIAIRYRSRRGFDLDKTHCGCVRNQIEALIRFRHGTLPDTDDRSIYLREWAFHNLRSKRQELQLQALCCRLGASISPAEITEVVGYVQRRSGRKYSPRSVGKHLRLTDFERTMYGITNIEACDVTPQERRRERRAMRTLKRREQRRAEGIKPRAVYLETSLSRTKPWEAEGISRRTWERRRDRLATTNGDRRASTKNRPVASVSHSTLLPVVLGDRPATSTHDQKADFRGRKVVGAVGSGGSRSAPPKNAVASQPPLSHVGPTTRKRWPSDSEQMVTARQTREGENR
jgi:hypothetical protein